MRDRRALAILAGISLAALALRVWVVLVVATREPTGGDPLYYSVQANLLADGHGFAEPFAWLERGEFTPSAIHPPGFTVWLSIASLLGFESIAAHKVMSAIAGAAAVFVIGLVARRVAGWRAGLPAAAIAAVHPNLWIVDGALMPESLFALGIALVLLAALHASSSSSTSVRLVVMLGLAIGLTALVRSEALLLAVLLGGWIAWRARSLAPAVVTVVVAVAVVAPWTIRNLVRFDSPVLLSANGDEVLRNANCDATWGGRLLGFWSLDCYVPEPSAGMDEAERAAFWRGEGLAYVRDHARRLPVVAGARLGRVWGVYRPRQTVELSTVEGRSRSAAEAGQLAYYALLVPAAFGAWSLRRRVLLWPFATTAILVTAVTVYAYGVIRFRMPAEVALVVLAGVGLSRARR